MASLEEDYLRLEQIALNEKQQHDFNKWLDEKIDAMYIYIDPEYRDGEFKNKKWVKKEAHAKIQIKPSKKQQQ